MTGRWIPAPWPGRFSQLIRPWSPTRCLRMCLTAGPTKSRSTPPARCLRTRLHSLTSPFQPASAAQLTPRTWPNGAPSRTRRCGSRSKHRAPTKNRWTCSASAGPRLTPTLTESISPARCSKSWRQQACSRAPQRWTRRPRPIRPGLRRYSQIPTRRWGMSGWSARATAAPIRSQPGPTGCG